MGSAARRDRSLEAARRHADRGEVQQALDQLQSIIELDPTDTAACIVLGDVYMQARQTAEAARAYVQAALACSEDGRLDEAIGLFRERVITGDFPGLTRDPVREGTLLDGYPYEVVDTAGEGPVDRGEAPEIDQRALSLARRERREGLLLLVADGSRPPSASDRNIRNQHTLVVRSKSDLPAAKWPEDFPSDVTVCCTAPDSASVVRRGVGEALRRLRNLPPAGPVGGVAALSGEELSRLEVARGEFGTGYSPPPV